MSEADNKRVDRATRVIAAGIDETYQAFIDPDAIVKWLPPKGARATLEAFVPWKGGAFRMKLVFADPHARITRREWSLRCKTLRPICNRLDGGVLVQLDDLDAPVLRPPFLGVIGRCRRQHADTSAAHALCIDAMVGSQCLDHCIGTAS
jgi:hypothetical protein